MKETRVWVDIDSGTYGLADNLRLVTFRPDQADLLAYFEDGSDNYRISVGEAWGEPV